MDVNDLRSLVTVVSMATFVGIVAWAWSRRNRDPFEEAALLPFQEEGQANPAPGADAAPEPSSGARA